MNNPQEAVDVTAAAMHGCDCVSRNLRVNGRRTSIRLEQALWQAFDDIAQRENTTIRDLCTAIDARRHGGNLTAAVRLFILGYFRSIATKAEASQPPLRVVETAGHNQGFADSAANVSPLMRQALNAIA